MSPAQVVLTFLASFAPFLIWALRFGIFWILL
jgi:hypothetical protein